MEEINICLKDVKTYLNPLIENLKKEKGKFLKTGIRITKSGDWDLTNSKIKNLITYKSIKLILSGVKFEETLLYSVGCKIIQRGDKAWRYKTEEEFKTKRYLEILNLYESIKKNGLIPASETKFPCHYLDNISIAIGRNGELLVFDGFHRFSIAMILDIKQIPINIVIQHPEWTPKKMELKKLIGDIAYNPIPHPDFKDIKAIWPESRLELIINDLKQENVKSIVELGSHYGYFSSELSKEGYDCTAYEKNKKYFYILNELRNANSCYFKTVNQDILTLDSIEADCILALNLFHHFLKKENEYNKFIKFLHGLKSNILYFQSHDDKEKQMNGSYKNFTPDEFCKLIIENSIYKTYSQIGKIKNRNIYKFKSI